MRSGEALAGDSLDRANGTLVLDGRDLSVRPGTTKGATTRLRTTVNPQTRMKFRGIVLIVAGGTRRSACELLEENRVVRVGKDG